MYNLLDDDLRKVVTCWSCSFSVVKLHIGLVHFGGNSKVVYWVGT